jgi:hypothetical protein
MADLTDLELLAALGVEAEPEKKVVRSPTEERIIAGFEEIQRFVDEHGRTPLHGEAQDIFERLYAVRLDRLRAQSDCVELLGPMDQGWLLGQGVSEHQDTVVELDDAALLAELGVENDATAITNLKNVRSTVEKKAAESVASRKKCDDFETFKPIFLAVQGELKDGIREARTFELKSEIVLGAFFIVGGQIAYVAEKGETFLTDQGRTDAKLRVIFDNGTESPMLMRSLQRALNADDGGKRITDPVAGPLFSQDQSEADQESGTIYVLRSKSDLPIVAQHGEVLHKIGVTGNDVEKRIAGAQLQPTFLLAGVEIVATYKLFNINRTKLENLLHRFFESARLDFTIQDRFGKSVQPREWFLVPLFIIDEAVERIRDQTISNYVYDMHAVKLVRRVH